MKTKLRNVKISMAFVAVFALLLLIADIVAPMWVGRYVVMRHMSEPAEVYLLITIYTGSVVVWYCLYCLYRLLKNIDGGEVFTSANSLLMKKISVCCITVSAIALISALYYIPFGFIGVAALFMSLIVNIVKGAFIAAQKMKDELDLTI